MVNEGDSVAIDPIESANSAGPSVGYRRTTHIGSATGGLTVPWPSRRGSSPLHRGAEVATVPGVRFRAPLRETTMSANQVPAISEGYGLIHHVPREGAGQVILIGLPNRRRTLLAVLSHKSTRRLGTLSVKTKLERVGARERRHVLGKWLDRQIPITSVKSRTSMGLETLGATTYHLVGVSRLSTKVPV
jgi:hypothetical protein